MSITCPRCGHEWEPWEEREQALGWGGGRSGRTTSFVIAEKWNEVARKHGLRMVRTVGPVRLKKLAARLRENPRWWEEIDAELAFLGKWPREKGFIDMDFLLTPSSLTKFLEGKYRDRLSHTGYETDAARAARQREEEQYRRYQHG